MNEDPPGGAESAIRTLILLVGMALICGVIAVVAGVGK